MNNPQLRKELVEKLPVALRLQWGEFIEAQDDLSSSAEDGSGAVSNAVARKI